MLSERFGPEFTRSVLWLMMFDESFSLGALKWLESSSFQHPQGWIFQEFSKSISQGRPPDLLIIRERAKDLGSQDVGLVMAEIDAVSKCMVHDIEGMKELIRDYAKRSCFAKSFHSAREMYLNNNAEDAYEYMTEQMETLRSISFDKVERAWLSEDFEERHKRRQLRTTMNLDGIPTGLAPLDNLTGGGIRAKQVFCIMSYSKQGKTQFLRHCGGIAVRMRKKVLHIQLEGSLEETTDAYDAWFSNELVQNIRSGVFDAEKLSTVRAAYKQLTNMLVVRCLNSWDVTVLDVEAEVRELRAMGFNPDVINLDYMDLLRARDKSLKGETEIQTQTSKDTKKLAVRTDSALNTATQVNRPREGYENKPHILRSSKLADAYAKLRPVDLLGSLNRTEDEANAGFARIFIEHFRHNQASMLFPVRTDYGVTKFFCDPTLKIDPLTKGVIDGSGVVNLNPSKLPNVNQQNWWDT